MWAYVVFSWFLPCQQDPTGNVSLSSLSLWLSWYQILLVHTHLNAERTDHCQDSSMVWSSTRAWLMHEVIFRTHISLIASTAHISLFVRVVFVFLFVFFVFSKAKEACDLVLKQVPECTKAQEVWLVKTKTICFAVLSMPCIPCLHSKAPRPSTFCI